MSEIISHNELAIEFSKKVKSMGYICCKKTWYKYQKKEGIFKTIDKDFMVNLVGEKIDPSSSCKIEGHYKAIVNLSETKSQDNEFFDNTVSGFPGKSFFYEFLKNGKIKKRKYSRKLRIRVKSNIDLDFKNQPKLFKWYLKEHVSKKTRELFLYHLRQAIIGEQYRLRKALLLLGPTTTGKSTFNLLLERIFKETHGICCVPPSEFKEKTEARKLSVSSFNLVGEIDSTNRIPIDVFKNIVGGDKLTGKLLWNDSFDFRSKATNIFCANHFPAVSGTVDGAFKNRWAIIESTNTIPEKKIDYDYCDKLMKEAPQIIGWILSRKCSEKKLDKGQIRSKQLVELCLNNEALIIRFIKKYCKKGTKYKTRPLHKTFQAEFEAYGARRISELKFNEILKDNFEVKIPGNVYTVYP